MQCCQITILNCLKVATGRTSLRWTLNRLDCVLLLVIEFQHPIFALKERTSNIEYSWQHWFVPLLQTLGWVDNRTSHSHPGYVDHGGLGSHWRRLPSRLWWWNFVYHTNIINASNNIINCRSFSYLCNMNYLNQAQ